jgi:hypothetical protein
MPITTRSGRYLMYLAQIERVPFILFVFYLVANAEPYSRSVVGALYQDDGLTYHFGASLQRSW